MSKLYTVDNKLLTDIPEIRIGEKIYAVDNRQKTVRKIHQITGAIEKDDSYTGMDKVLELAMGAEAAREIDEMNMPFPAYEQMFELVMAAVTGEDPKTVADDLRA